MAGKSVYLNYLFRYIFTISIILNSSEILICQSGSGTNTISGVISDSDTKNPIPFSIVFLKNTLIGTSADLNGYFEIKNIPSGNFEIIFSQAGYTMQSRIISLYVGNEVKIDITLSPKVIPFNEVEIIAHASDEWKKDIEIFGSMTYSVGNRDRVYPQ